MLSCSITYFTNWLWLVFLFILDNVFSAYPSLCLFPSGMQIHILQCIINQSGWVTPNADIFWYTSIGFICLTFLHCAFWNVSSNCLHKKRHNYIGCICLTFLHCVFSSDSLNCVPGRMHTHIDCICSIFLDLCF